MVRDRRERALRAMAPAWSDSAESRSSRERPQRTVPGSLRRRSARFGHDRCAEPRHGVDAQDSQASASLTSAPGVYFFGADPPDGGAAGAGGSTKSGSPLSSLVRLSLSATLIDDS